MNYFYLFLIRKSINYFNGMDRLELLLLWGQTTEPRKFELLSEFTAWAVPLGFSPEECRAAWIKISEAVRLYYRP
jgi:hypothetical protein